MNENWIKIKYGIAYALKLEEMHDLHTEYDLIVKDAYRLKDLPKSSYVVLDIGANIGVFYQALKHNEIEIAHYIGIEPIKENMEKLQKNIPGNCTLLQRSVEKESNRQVKFTIEYSSSRKNEDGCEIVRTIAFNEILDQAYKKSRELERKLLVKIDIEGEEMEILDDINRAMYNKKIDILLMELHQKTELKFKHEKISGGKELYVIKAKK